MNLWEWIFLQKIWFIQQQLINISDIYHPLCLGLLVFDILRSIHSKGQNSKRTPLHRMRKTPSQNKKSRRSFLEIIIYSSPRLKRVDSDYPTIGFHWLDFSQDFVQMRFVPFTWIMWRPLKEIREGRSGVSISWKSLQDQIRNSRIVHQEELYRFMTL